MFISFTFPFQPAELSPIELCTTGGTSAVAVLMAR
jgi:hypothetical protein